MGDMTAKERSDELTRLVVELNAALVEAANEGIEVWVRTAQNQRIGAAPISAVSVSIQKWVSA